MNLNRCIAMLTMLLVIPGCTKFDILDLTIPRHGYLRTSNQSYGNFPRQKLDIYRPKKAKSPAPVVVFFYGGDWQDGSKTGYRFVAQALSSKGFVTVMPDYRLYPEVTFPAFVEDGAMAVRWVHDNISKLGGDPKRVYLMGHSAGAHIAALLTLDRRYLENVGLDRSVIRATAALSGPYDFIPSAEDAAVFRMSPGDRNPDPDMEPIHFADGTAPPMLLVTGMKDPTVDPQNAIKLADHIRSAGGNVQLITYRKKGHVDIVLSMAKPFRWLAPVLRDTTSYFRQIERNERPATRPGEP